MSEASQIRWGVLGAGMIARGVTPCIARAEECAVAGVAAREPERARAMLDEIGVEGEAYTYDELLRADDVDAVYVTLPNHLHTEWTCRFLRAGKHVLCEKPLCATRAEAEQVRDGARETGRLAGEAFMYMHHSQTAILRDLARDPDGPLGRLQRVRAAFCVHPTHEPTIRTRMSYACHGGCIMDLGCYSLSFVGLLDGHDGLTIDSVVMTPGSPLEGETLAVDDDMVVRGRVLDAEFVAESSFRDARGVFVELVGEKATARTGWPWSPDPTQAIITMTAPDGSPLPPIEVDDGGEKYQLQFETFARCVRAGREFTPSMAWSVEQAGMIERLREEGGLSVFSRP